MKPYLIALLSSAAMIACTNVPVADTPPPQEVVAPLYSAAEIEAETTRLNEWFEAKYEEQLLESPIQLTFLGRKERYGEIDDVSQAAADRQFEWMQAATEEMQSSFEYNKLTEDAQISYDLWVYQFEQQKASRPFDTNGYVFDQMSAIHGFFPQLLVSFHSVETEQDMVDFNSRIDGSARAIRQLIVASKENAEAGTRPPAFAFEAVIDEATKILSGYPFDESGRDNDVLAAAVSKANGLVEAGTISQDRADELIRETETKLLADWRSAYMELIAWQEEDRVNAPQGVLGVSRLNNGEAYYNERLANNTTTSLTADEIHEIGLREVARLRSEMEAVQALIGFEGSLQDFFKHLRDTKDDPNLYFPNTDEGRQGYIDDATAAIDKIKAELPNYFGILPKADLVVRRVESFREQDGAAQHYYPGTPDGSRPGIYYAHLSDMTAMPKRELEVIAYHEGLPGHHMQIAIAQELESVPTFRTQANFTAYAEGWGLYSELLAKEIPGTYEDPYSEFGRLGSEMWRAIRLVLDTGLHSKGWTEDQAVTYFTENSAITEAQASSEVRRYIVLPGQATSYKIGMIKIIELRQKAEAALGDQFDIRGFHDTVLGGGAVPLDLLERKVDQWIASVQAS